MKLSKSSTAVLLLSTTLLSLPASADSWWDTVTNLFSSSSEEITLSDEQIGKGLKETLSLSTQSAIANLSKPGGFSNNPDLKIGLPDSLQGVKKALDKVGMGHYVTDLQTKLNEAAESAVPAVGPILLKAIKDLSLEDVQGIYKGDSDAATTYFKETMSKPIGDAMMPVIKKSLEGVGAMATYDKLMEKYNALPFVNKVDGDLTGLVKNEALSGIFDSLAKEEAAIRKDPVKQTTELLKQLFKSN